MTNKITIDENTFTERQILKMAQAELRRLGTDKERLDFIQEGIIDNDNIPFDVEFKILNNFNQKHNHLIIKEIKQRLEDLRLLNLKEKEEKIKTNKL